MALGNLEATALERAESHLRSCADCRTVLVELADSLEQTSGSSGRETLTVSVARYSVLEVIGAGAAGVVYRAFDPDLRRTVALKLMRRDVAQPTSDMQVRMLREAQAMAKLSHPHVVAVYDVGVHEGSVYIVMEFVDGLTLGQWLEREERNAEAILRVFLDAGRGLQAAHEQGLVHRDFKPENVLVSRSGVAKVTDFGLARAGAAAVDAAPGGTTNAGVNAQTLGLVGTLAYMAPEQFEGGVADAASDQFSYCVALYAALAGQHPFGAGRATTFAELVIRIKAFGLEPAARGRQLPPHVLSALHRGLSAQPSARFSSMQQLLDALSTRQTARKHVLASIALAGVLGLAAAAFAVSPRTSGSAPAPSARVSDLAASPAPAAANPAVTALVTATTAAPTASERTAPATSARRPARAPGSAARSRDVRYRDWLKDPF